jgi:hypothetical protein
MGRSLMIHSNEYVIAPVETSAAAWSLLPNEAACWAAATGSACGNSDTRGAV